MIRQARVSKGDLQHHLHHHNALVQGRPNGPPIRPAGRRSKQSAQPGPFNFETARAGPHEILESTRPAHLILSQPGPARPREIFLALLCIENIFKIEVDKFKIEVGPARPVDDFKSARPGPPNFSNSARPGPVNFYVGPARPDKTSGQPSARPYVGPFGRP